MRILIDMNLSPIWVIILKRHGFHAIHWSEVGKPNAPDEELFEWAIKNNHLIFTHDLDFGTLLAAAKTNCPSVLQTRTQDISPEKQIKNVIAALTQFSSLISGGALITIDDLKARVRILPI